MRLAGSGGGRAANVTRAGTMQAAPLVVAAVVASRQRWPGVTRWRLQIVTVGRACRKKHAVDTGRPAPLVAAEVPAGNMAAFVPSLPESVTACYTLLRHRRWKRQTRVLQDATAFLTNLSPGGGCNTL